uniref:COP9 signalosome subunit 8 n=1 Tax=Equus asinus TaxID=9793 RepID=A0A9L0IK72_EQUAS
MHVYQASKCRHLTVRKYAQNPSLRRFGRQLKDSLPRGSASPPEHREGRTERRHPRPAAATPIDAPEPTARLRMGRQWRRRRLRHRGRDARRDSVWSGCWDRVAAAPAGKMPVAVMAEGAFSFKKLLDQCENQELEAPGGIATPPVYGQLLALYLLHNDMNNARYLWKRIPPAIKSANSELGGIWSVGQRIWQRDFPGIYTTINAHQWSETVQPIMEALRGPVEEWIPSSR